jgi:hypothetical protein
MKTNARPHVGRYRHTAPSMTRGVTRIASVWVVAETPSRHAAQQHLSAFSVQVSASEYFSCRCDAIARLIMQLALALSTACAVSNLDLSHADGLNGVVVACWFKAPGVEAPASCKFHLVHSMLKQQQNTPQGPTAVQTHRANRCSNFPVTSRCSASPTSKIWLSNLSAFIHFCTAWPTMPCTHPQFDCASALSTTMHSLVKSSQCVRQNE